MGKLSKALKKVAKKLRKAAAKAEATLSNATGGTLVRPAKLPKHSRCQRCRMRGWNDVIEGKPFRDGYDLWPTQYKKTGKLMQWAYERGRDEAARAKGLLRNGGQMTPWDKNEYVQGPMYRAVGAMVGEQIIDEMRRTVRSRKGK